MGAGAIPIVLTFALMFVAWQVVFSSNRDLVRAREWGELTRRLLPFVAILAMTASLPLVQDRPEPWAPYAWALAFAVLVLVANLLSMPLDERRATRAFRREDYAEAATLYRRLAEERHLARYWAFLGAAVGAAGKNEEGVDASTKAIELDPEYGLAYYNRALILRRLGRKSRAAKDLKRALEADLPRRMRAAARRTLEDL